MYSSSLKEESGSETAISGVSKRAQDIRRSFIRDDVSLLGNTTISLQAAEQDLIRGDVRGGILQ